MNKRILLTNLLVLLMGIQPMFAHAQNVQERIIYSTTFQDWETAGSSTTATIVTKQTFQQFDFTVSFLKTSVAPAGTNAKFTAEVATEGYMMMDKSADTYIEFSAMPSITSISFVQAATGGTRGLSLKVKGDGDEDWVYLHNKSIGTAAGESLTYEVNRTNVQIRFENFASNQNAYLLSLELKGNVEITAPQVNFTTGISPEAAGTITQNPNGTEFDEGTEITLTAQPAFGFAFSKWVDASGKELSTDNPLIVAVNNDMTVSAIFTQKNIYSLQVAATGGANAYLVSVSPKGTVIDGVTYFEEGTQVSLSAAGNKLMTFTNWEDNSTEASRIFTINENTSVTANYSATEFIVGWDMHLDEPKSQRAADYFAETENKGMLSMHKADGTTSSWLSKGFNGGQYEGRYAAVNWQPFTADDNYFYELTFSTVGYINVKVCAAMLFNYNAFSQQKVQYAIGGVDNMEYKDLGTYNLETAKTWYDKEFELPQEAWGVEKVYVRFMPDYTSPVVGTSSGNDGTGITDIFVIADRDDADDSTPPTLLNSLPENNSTGISANGSIILTFDERVFAGAGGNCTLDGEILNATFSGKTVVFKYSGLSYNKEYTFTIPAGAITDRSGNAFEGKEIKFTTMERIQAVPRLYDAVVAADGSGDYETVVEAIAAAPENRVTPYLIFIKEGTYKGHIEIPAGKPYIYLIGQDADKVIITDDQLCGGEEAVTGKPALHVSLGATVVVQASNFFAENISFENSWGIEKNGGPQALALFSNNDRIILNNCKLRSYQDTYLTSTKNVSDRHYLKNCFIEGAVDFIYGGGDVFFDECTLNIVRKSGGYIVAPSHKPDTQWGYVFMNNTITAPAPAIETSVWLGRPWKDAPKTVFLNTRSEVTIPAAGWHDNMGAIPAIFADYNTMDANGNPVDLSNRIKDYWYWEDDEKTKKVTGVAKNKLTPEEAGEYTIKNVLSGSDSWQPAFVTEAVDAPIISGNETTISWKAVPYAICYVITKGEKVIAFTTETTYTDADGVNGDYYTVQAANEFGGLSAMSNIYNIGGTSIESPDNNGNVQVYSSKETVFVGGITGQSQIEVFDMSGKLLNKYLTETDFDFSIKAGSYIVRVISEDKLKSFVVLVY